MKRARSSVSALAVWTLAIVGLVPEPGPTLGQAAETGAEESRILEVRRRQLMLATARSELARQTTLFDEGLISDSQLEDAKAKFALAEIEFQRSLLSFLALTPRVTVASAVKHRAADGGKAVKLTLVNATPAFDLGSLPDLAGREAATQLLEDLTSRHLHDVYVSLKDTGEPSPGNPSPARGTIIGLPYEVRIPVLEAGEAKTIEFQLLRDPASVQVAVSYRGHERVLDLQLQQAATTAPVSMSSTQISQEADLGSQVTYDLLLERSSVGLKQVQILALNLASEIGYRFVDPDTGARLSEIVFSAGVRQVRLQLRLFLPDRASEQVPIDQAYPFWALVTTGDEAEAFRDQRRYSPTEIEQSGAGYLRLQVIPRGIGKLEIVVSRLFFEVDQGAKIDIPVTLRNAGTRPLNNVRVTTETPGGWRTEETPDLVL